MKIFTPLLRIGATLGLVTGLVVVAGTTAQADHEVGTHSGNAYSIRAAGTYKTLLGTTKSLGPVVLGSTGELPSDGGTRTNKSVNLTTGISLLNVQAAAVDNLVTGDDDYTFAEADTANVYANIGSGALIVTANALNSWAYTECLNNGAVYSQGDSLVAGLRLRVAGVWITIPDADYHPNYTKRWGKAGTITTIINEQYINDDGEKVVNALHIKVAGGLGKLSTADIIIGHSEAGVTCGEEWAQGL